jgi:hypothetical protein
MPLIPQPSVSDILTVQPEYDNPRYLPALPQLINEAYLLYGSVISDLPQTHQLLAIGYAVCALFQIRCWSKLNYPGVPTELASRNESVKFGTAKKGGLVFEGTICGKKLLALIKNNTNAGFYGVPNEGCQPACCVKMPDSF